MCLFKKAADFKESVNRLFGTFSVAFLSQMMPALLLMAQTLFDEFWIFTTLFPSFCFH